MSAKIEGMESEKLRPNLIVQGIDEDKSENCVAKIKKFFKDELELVHDIHIKFAHRLGKGKNRPIKVVLVNSADKGLIYSNANKLQGKKSKSGKSYKIDDQLPARQQELKNKSRHFIWRNKKSTAEKIELSVKRGQLQVEGTPYNSKIKIPDDQKLSKLKPDEIKELNKIKVRKGVPEIYGGSTFTGYISDNSSFDDVNKAYEWVRFHNLDARHIVCACKIPGSTVIDSFAYEDHEEHGAGQRILKYMDEVGLDNRAVFITRHYDGTHIGPQHFECMIKAAKSAVNQKPFNEVTGSYQFSWSNKKSRRRGQVTGFISSRNSDGHSTKTESEISFDQCSAEIHVGQELPWEKACPSPSRPELQG